MSGQAPRSIGLGAIAEWAPADSKGEPERLRTISDLDRAALRLRDAMRVVLDASQPDLALRAAIFALVPREQLEKDVNTVDKLSRSEDETHYYEHLVHHYSQMRRFLPTLLQTIEFDGTSAAQPVLEALAFLKRREGKPDISMDEAPQSVICANWRKLVFSNGEVPDQRFYTLCTLARLRMVYTAATSSSPKVSAGAIRAPSCLKGDAWNQARPAICRTLGRQTNAEPELQALATQLNEAYRRAGESLGAEDPDVRVEKKNGRDRLCLTPLDKLD